MHNLSSDSAATESYSDYDPHKENSMREDAQGSSPTDCKEGNDSFEMGKGTDELIPPLESNELPGGPAECKMELPLQNTELNTNGNHIISEQACQADNLVAPDGPQSPLLPPPLPISAEYAQDACKLDGAGSEEIPNLEATSDAMVLDSDDIVPIREISSGGVLVASHPEDKGIEQNPDIHNNDEAYPSTLPDDYIEHVSADGMHPPALNDLPMGSSEPGGGEEILAKDLYKRESE